jgi:putative ABC transport system permease protein
MGPLLVRASLRQLRRAPGRFGLALLGIALGVALGLGIDLANVSVRRAFTLSSEALTGRATHQIQGGPGGLPESLYRALVLDPAIGPGVALAPFVGAQVAVRGRPGVALELAGIDPFAAPGLGPRQAVDEGFGDPGALAALLVEPGAAAVTARGAAAIGVQVGDRLDLQVGAVTRTLRIAAVLPGGDAGTEGLALVDVATAQETLDRLGRLDRIDVRVDTEPARARLEAALPPGVRLDPAAARQGALLQMTRAFDLNLRALSLLGLVVGAFLIYNTMTLSVVERRPLLAVLRTLGVTRGQVFALVCLEAAIVGGLGTAVGLLLGTGLAQALVGLVARTVTDLYFAVAVREVTPVPGPYWRGAALGVAAALLSALPAAREATRVAPRAALSRSVLEEGARRLAGRLAMAALLAFAAAAALLLGSRRALGPAFLAVLLLAVGAAFLAPGATALLARGAAPVLRRMAGLPGVLASRNVGATLSRTGVAVAALAVALSVTAAVGIMVGSFRRAVAAWLGETLIADVYVSTPGLVAARPEGTLPRDLEPRLRALPEVAAVATNRTVRIEGPHGPVLLLAIGRPADGRGQPRLVQGDPAAAVTALERQDALLVSEPYAFRHGTRVGEALVLTTARGPRPFTVVGVFRDYGTDAGALMTSRTTYERHFDDRETTALALWARGGVDAEALVARVRAALRPEERLLVRSNASLRAASLEVFDRTFEITAVLRLLAVVVAAFGVAGALVAIELPRARELGVLRALGLTVGQVRALLTAETTLLGLFAGVLAVPLGAVLSAVLVHVINRRSFGWTMDLALDPAALATAPLLGAAAGFLAGLYPARVLARTSPAEALRND